MRADEPPAASAPALPKWKDVCGFALSNGRLVITPGPALTDALSEQDDLKLEGLEGTTRVTLSLRGMRLRNTVNTAPGAMSHVISVNPQQTSIEATATVRGRTRTVLLVQGGPAPGRRRMRPGGIRLTIYGEGAPGGSVNVEGADFDALRAQYPIEINQFLRPVFRRLRVPLLDVEPAVIRQVLTPTRRKPAEQKALRDSEDIGDVTALPGYALVDELDTPGFARREAAIAELRKLGEPAAVMLRQLDAARLSAQQNFAISRVLVDSHPISFDEARQRRGDVQFLLDCLYTPDEEALVLAIDQLRQVTGLQIEVDPKSTPDDRAEAIEKLRAALTAKADSQ